MDTTYSADVNGITINAANTKLLEKLVKKEQARQAAMKAERDANDDRANEIAWAHYGKTLFTIKKDPSPWFTTPTIRRIDDYYQAVKVDHHRHGTADFRMGTEYQCTAILMTISGDTLALRSYDPYVLNDKGLTWFAVGSYHGAIGYRYLEDDDSAALEALYQADLAKRAQEAA